MDFMSPPMIALYVIIAAFTIAYLYVVITGNRLSNLSVRVATNPDSFKDKKSKSQMKPLYPQRVTIGGYDIRPQPHDLDVSNELVKQTIAKSCTIDPKCCTF